MSQSLHGYATTTEAVGRELQKSRVGTSSLPRKPSVGRTTVRKWRARDSVHDAAMGTKNTRLTVLQLLEEELCVKFRSRTPLPLDDCLYRLQEIILHLLWSTLHRHLQNHNISLADGRTKTERIQMKTGPKSGVGVTKSGRRVPGLSASRKPAGYSRPHLSLTVGSWVCRHSAARPPDSPGPVPGRADTGADGGGSRHAHAWDRVGPRAMRMCPGRQRRMCMTTARFVPVSASFRRSGRETTCNVSFRGSWPVLQRW